MKSIFLRLFIILGLVFLSDQRIEDTNVQVLFSWRYPDWMYPSEEARQVAEQQGLYVPQNGVILDSDYYFDRATSLKRVFVSTPQFRPGIPATLSEVTRRPHNGSYLLRPFPNWDAQSRVTCDGPVSVYRFHIDRCGLLWALDTGRVDTFVNAIRACRPKLVVYDLNHNDAVILRYEFPDGSINDRSNLATIVTESYRSDCRDSIAYIADTNAYGLVVFDLPRKNSWRVDNPYFFPFPHKATFSVNNVVFDLMDGLFALTLSSPKDTNRKLFFHGLASVREGWVPVSVLKNSSFVSNAMELRKSITISEDTRTSQSTMEVMTDDGILLYALLARNAIACWNSRTLFRPENQYIVYENDENLQFISGMKLKGNQLLITSSRLQNYINGDLLRDDVKYRLVVIDDVNQLLVHTPCTRLANAGLNLVPSSSSTSKVNSSNTNFTSSSNAGLNPSSDSISSTISQIDIRQTFLRQNQTNQAPPSASPRVTCSRCNGTFKRPIILN